MATMVLQRMASVAVRAARRPQAAAVETVERREAPVLHDQGPATWTPRPLPEPMVSVTGSRAQAARAEIDAQEERRKAARVAALRARAEEMAPPAPVTLPAASTESPYARMGFVDDAEIEEHVRRLLQRRAAG